MSQNFLVFASSPHSFSETVSSTFKAAGNPETPTSLAHTFHAGRRSGAGGSAQRRGDNSCCHVGAFTVKLRHAEAMSLRSRWRSHAWTQLFWWEASFWMLLIKKERRKKKRAFPIKERQVPLQSADNKTSRNMKLFTSLTLLLTVQSDQLPVFCVLHLSKQTAACKENVKWNSP